MRNDLLVIIIQISEILRETYGLSLEESVKCINQYGDISSLVKSKECIEVFTHWELHNLAKSMYDYYEENKNKNSVVAKLIERENQVRSIISNPDYVNWIDTFTKTLGCGFNDDEWLYYDSDEVSKEDLDKAFKISLLFDGIMGYADDNGIEGISIEEGVYYNVRYNDFMFKIGVAVGQGGYCFCGRIDDGEGIEFIDFNDVMNSVKDSPVEKKLTPSLDNK